MIPLPPVFTSTVAEPLAPPGPTAEIMACPEETAVTKPLESTDATAEFELLQVIEAPAIVIPWESTTVAINCCVAPKGERVAPVGDNSTLSAPVVVDVEVEVEVLVAVLVFGSFPPPPDGVPHELKRMVMEMTKAEKTGA